MRTLQDAPQGSAAWHAARAQHFCASEAPAAMGVSKYMPRAALLKQKATGITEEVSEAKQRLFDAGHASEAATIQIANQIAGVQFYPSVGVCEVEGLPLLASFDGIDMMEEVVWENKLLNSTLAEQVDRCELEPHYWAQLEHQLLVSGATKALFTTSDGIKAHYCWYESRPERRAQLIAAWKQFAADLAVYVPTEVKERPSAEVTLALPALVIHAKGEITTSNMKEYGEALTKRLSEVRAIQLITDQDFSNAKESAKLLRENIQQAKHAKEAMLAQTVTVGEAARMIDSWCEDMRLTALKLEQDVEREDRIKKAAMVAKARSAYDEHIETLMADTGGPWIVLPAPDWAAALKSKRNFASMQDALDTMLANAKIIADESARKIRASLACMEEEGKGYEFLLSDRLAHIGKPAEDVRTLVRARITEHKAAEERRAAELAERERERIRAEEAAKLRDQQEAEARAARLREEDAARERLQSEATAAPVAAAPHPVAAVIAFAAGERGVVVGTASPILGSYSRSQRAADAAPTLRIGAIAERLGWSMTAEQLRALGIQPAGKDRAATLYHEHQFASICEAIAKRALLVREDFIAAARAA